MKKTARLLVAGLSLALAAALGGCGSDSSGDSSDGSNTIRLAANTNATVLPAWVALDKGYFDKNGLDVKLTTIENIATLPPALNKSFDIALSTPTLLISAAKQGIPATWVAGSSINTKDDSNTLLIAGKDSGVKSAADMDGKTLGVLNDTGTIHIATLYWLQQEGVDISSLKVVQVDAPNMADQVKSGRVDAVEVTHPYTENLLKSGAVNLGAPYAHLSDDVSGIMWIAQQQWAKDHPELISKFVTSLEQAQSYIKSNDSDARTILQKHTGLPQDVVDTTPLPHFDTAVRPQDLEVWLDAMKKVTGFDGDPDLAALAYSGK